MADPDVWNRPFCMACETHPKTVDERGLCADCATKPVVRVRTEGGRDMIWVLRKDTATCVWCGELFDRAHHHEFTRRCAHCWAAHHGPRALKTAGVTKQVAYDAVRRERLMPEDIAQMSGFERAAIYGLGKVSVEYLNGVIPYVGDRAAEVDQNDPLWQAGYAAGLAEARRRLLHIFESV